MTPLTTFGSDLPQTLSGCYAMIRELRARIRELELSDDERLEHTGAIVGDKLGVTPQCGALLTILANARGRPLTAPQIEIRLPGVFKDARSIKTVHVQVSNIRRMLGSAAILNTRGVGYWIDPEVGARVRRAAA